MPAYDYSSYAPGGYINNPYDTVKEHQHLKYSASLIRPECKSVLVEIVEQTHRHTGFGDRGTFTHGDCKITDVYRYPTYSLGLWVSRAKLTVTLPQDGQQFLYLSVADYSIFKECVKAYNEEYRKRTPEELEVEAKEKERLNANFSYKFEYKDLEKWLNYPSAEAVMPRRERRVDPSIVVPKKKPNRVESWRLENAHEREYFNGKRR